MLPLQILSIVPLLAFSAPATSEPDVVGESRERSAVLEMMKDYPITVIIIDDIGHEFLAAAHTPVIDKLANEGVWFRQAWAYPM